MLKPNKNCDVTVFLISHSIGSVVCWRPNLASKLLAWYWKPKDYDYITNIEIMSGHYNDEIDYNFKNENSRHNSP